MDTHEREETSPGNSDDASAGFATLALDARLLQALTALGYEEPTPIQSETIPPLLAGRDMVGQAATGTGKTAAFALPLLQRMLAQGEERPIQPFGLILVPTRELAIQVAEAVYRYGRPVQVRVLPIYGGQAYGQQLRGLRRGVDVVVATPGRALDHIRRSTLALDGLGVVVLDEADEMLDMGFAEDLEAILDETPAERQTVLFSATMPPRIASLAKRYLRDPAQVRIARERMPAGEEPRVRQTGYIVSRAHKRAALGRILDMENPAATLVFCRTRNAVDELTEALNARGYRCEALHGGMSQEQRDRVMKKLRGGTSDLLVATDVAARGLDIPQLTHVVNYDVPSASESYVHRIGRVGRAGREGVAITLAEPREHRLLRNIEQLTKRKIEVAKVPTVADLRARRFALTQAAVREALAEDEVEQFRGVVESLADEFDLMEIAMAAVKLAHEATSPEQGEEPEIPDLVARAEQRGPGPRPRGPGGARSGPRGRGLAGNATRLYIGAGRGAGMRPQDLVGAITGEAGIAGRDIGAIEIADRFSLVEVPENMADQIIEALRGSQIKGKRVTVRRERQAR